MVVQGQDEEWWTNACDKASQPTFPMQCSALRINGLVMIKGRPCKIVEMSTSKTGKHMVALDIFTQKKYEDICSSTHNVDVPNITRRDYQLLDVSDDGYLSLMDISASTFGNIRDDLKNPDGELGDEIKGAISDGKDILVS